MTSTGTQINADYNKILNGNTIAIVLLKKDDALGLYFSKAYGKLIADLKLNESEINNINPVAYFGNDQAKSLLLGAFNGEPSVFEFRKRSRYFQCSLEPIIDENDEVQDVVCTIFEVTEKRKAERNYSLLAQTVASLNEAISIADADDTFIYVNPAFSKLYGYTIEELENKKSDIMWSSLNSPEVTAQILPGTLEGGWKGYLYNKNKNGTDFLIRLRTSPIYSGNGEMIGVVGVANEVEPHLRLEADAFAKGNPFNPQPQTSHQNNTITQELSNTLGLNLEPLKTAYQDCFIVSLENELPQSNYLWFTEQLDRNLLCLIESTTQDSMSVFRSLMIKGFLDQIVNGNFISLPDQVLNKLHHVITPYLQLNYNLDGTDPELNVAYCNISKNKQTFRFSGANMCVALSSGGKIRNFDGEAKSFASEDGEIQDRYFKVHTLNVRENDIIYLFSQSLFSPLRTTDSYPIDKNTLINFLETIHQLPMDQQQHCLTERLQLSLGNETTPDRNMLLIALML